jgi:hypothetical protein
LAYGVSIALMMFCFRKLPGRPWNRPLFDQPVYRSDLLFDLFLERAEWNFYVAIVLVLLAKFWPATMGLKTKKRQQKLAAFKTPEITADSSLEK